jgi:hypothetical protein
MQHVILCSCAYKMNNMYIELVCICKLFLKKVLIVMAVKSTIFWDVVVLFQEIIQTLILFLFKYFLFPIRPTKGNILL